MPDFGYTINPDRQIDYDRNDHRVAVFLAEYEPSFRVCMACGTCTATCSAGVFTDFSLREVIGNIRRGEVGRIRIETGKCMLCGKCQLACPRGVNTRNVVLGIQHAIEKFKL